LPVSVRVTPAGIVSTLGAGLVVVLPVVLEMLPTDVAGTLDLRASSVHEIPFDTAHLSATLRQSLLSVTTLEASGPVVEGRGAGVVAFDETQPNAFDYDITRADLARLPWIANGQASGTAATKGRLAGSWNALRAAGDASVGQLEALSVKALTVNGQYDLTMPAGDVDRLSGKVDGNAAFVELAGQSIKALSGTVTIDRQRLGVNLRVERPGGLTGTVNGAVRLRLDQRAVDLSGLTIGLGRAPWRLVETGGIATIGWDDRGVSIAPITFAGGNSDEQVTIAGDWRTDGSGALHIVASHVFLDSLQAAFERPTRYGGVLDLDVTVRGTADHPTVAGTLTVTNGRVERLPYQKLAAGIQYGDRTFTLDARLDQSPGVWITAKGTAPLSLVDRTLPEQPLDVTIKSSGIDLGLIEGLTSTIRRVSGRLLLDVRAVGTSRDPHFTGAISIDNAAFDVVPSGAKYKNARLGLTLTTDRVAVDAFHVEDANGRALEVRGSLGTHELRVGDLEIEISARRFEVLRNELGRLDVDARLQLRGRFESPRLTGELTIAAGELKVDEILTRALFQPYATEPVPITEVDPIAALNPWQRLGIDLTLHVPNTLRLTGDNVQVTPGTPIGLGDIGLRAAGDLYLYKDPEQPLYVTGSFDALSGTFAFQGRRFDVDPASSIVFRGDLSPELYVGVTRIISGVETRVGLIGPLGQPELRLSSTPPLGESDILSLIVFNTSSNDLTALQQQELVARAGALAAGFLATPLVTAFSNQIGLDILEIEPTDEAGVVGAKVTVGQELAPGLVARFSRQFGSEPYDEATIEYYLSKILRLRATFSDAQSLSARSPFRRVERAGIDLLLFFSF
jgi:autotransporter translocation and assembly factor TamB